MLSVMTLVEQEAGWMAGAELASAQAPAFESL